MGTKEEEEGRLTHPLAFSALSAKWFYFSHVHGNTQLYGSPPDTNSCELARQPFSLRITRTGNTKKKGKAPQ